MEGLGDRECKIPNQRCRSSHYFDYSSPIDIETSQVSSFDDFIRPINGLNSQGPYQFQLETMSQSFIQMQHLELEIRFRVMKGDGQKLVAADNVALINNIGQAMWKQCECKLNNQDFHGNTAVNSGLKSYIETILSYEKSALSTHAITKGFYLDSIGKFDVCSDQNAGFKKRKEMIALSRTCDVYTTLCNDFLRSGTFLAPGNTLSIRLTRHSDNFLLMTDSDTIQYYIEIEDLKLFYRRSLLNQNDTNQIIGKDERYISKKTELLTFPLGAGLQTKSLNLVTGSILPKSVVVAMNLTEACEGKYSLNPFNFQAFGLIETYLKINGKSYPGNSLKPDFEKNNFAREYSWLFGEVGCLQPDRALCITPEGFKDGGGLSIIPYDLGPDRCNQTHRHQGVMGTIDLELRWKAALTNPITILVYMCYDQIVKIPKASGRVIEITYF